LKFGDLILNLFRQLDARRARGMKEDFKILRKTKSPDRPLRYIRPWLHPACYNDSAEMSDQSLWIARVPPVGHPRIADRIAALGAAIII
jgi:hypothetical protein